MPAQESSMLLVARFLKLNGYTASYEAFIGEANLSEEDVESVTTRLTIEKLLEEKRLFDQSVNFEKLSIAHDDDQGWLAEGPSTASEVKSLPSSANLLSIVVADSDDGGKALLTTTADRRVSKVGLSSLNLESSWSDVQDSPILSQVIIGRYHISAAMSGAVVVASLETGQVLERRKDHAKYVVGVAYHDDPTRALLATAGWDNKINVYNLSQDGGSILGEPSFSISLPTKPESLLFATDPSNFEAILVVTRNDSSYLHFYSTIDGSMLGRQNLAPHSNAWVAFTPISISLCPSDKTLLAVATNSTPHMKLIIVQLLFPRSDKVTFEPQTAREEAVMQQRITDREDKAIKLHCNTLSAQTPYSTPLVVWRPAGKGVWVNGDDGVIRGIDTLAGKVVKELRGHEPGTKVRTLWAGMIGPQSNDEEVLVSGGFDHKLIVWRP